jgi:hypothetical protein
MTIRVGDNIFEVGVVEGVVRGMYGQTLILGVGGGAFGYSPRYQYIANLQAKIIM